MLPRKETGIASWATCIYYRSTKDPWVQGSTSYLHPLQSFQPRPRFQLPETYLGLKAPAGNISSGKNDAQRIKLKEGKDSKK